MRALRVFGALAACATARTCRQIGSLVQRGAARPSLTAPPPARPFHGAGLRSLRAPTMVAAEGFGNVDVGAAHNLVQDDVAKYVDVRTPEEFAAGHAPGAVNVPVMLKQGPMMTPNPQFLQQFEAAFPHKDASLVVGCLSGKRSVAAAQQLVQAGYTGVHNVEGGFQAWTSAGLPVTQA